MAEAIALAGKAKSHAREETTAPIVTLEDFLKEEYPAPESLLAPWLNKGDLSMVYAPTGIGKTWFTLGVAWAVATGGRFATWNGYGYRNEAKAHKVLVMDFEMAAQELQERFGTIRKRAKPLVSHEAERQGLKNLSIYAITRLEAEERLSDLSREADCKRLIEIAQPFDLVIIDNLSTSMKPEDENKPEAFQTLQSALLELRKQGKAVILVHHTNKAGDQRGSSAKTTVLNTVLALEKITDRRGEHFGITITFKKHRNLLGADRDPVDLWVEREGDSKEWWRAETSQADLVQTLVQLVRRGICKDRKQLLAILEAEAKVKLRGPQAISELKSEAIVRGLIDEAGWRQHMRRAKTPEAQARFEAELRRLKGSDALDEEC